MAEYKISGDIATLLGEDHATGEPAALWVEASQPVILDGTTGRLGGKIRATINTDGTFEVSKLPESVSGTVPLYRLTVDSRSLRRAGTNNGYTTRWFPLTTNRDLTWIVSNYVDIVGITPAVAANVAAAAALGATNNTATASFITSAGATQTALDARMAARAVQVSEAPLNVSRYGVVGDGTTDMATQMNAALTAAAGVANAEVYIPPQSAYIRVNSTITIPNGVRLFAANLAYTEIRGTGTANTITFAPGDSQRLDHIQASASGGGHVLAIPNASGFRVTDTLLVQYAANKSCVYHLGPGTFIDATFDRCTFNAAPGATVSPIHLENGNNDLQATRWRDCRLNGNATMTAPFIRLLNTAPAVNVNHLNNHTFRDITAEICVGGILHASSVNGITVDHVAPWDVSGNYTDDIFKFYAQPGGVQSRNILVSHSGRRGGGLAAGKYDVNFSSNSTECIAMFMAPMHAPSTAAAIFLPTVNGMKFMCGSTSPMIESSYAGSFKLPSPSTGDRGSAATAGAGAVIWNSTTSIPNFSDGTNWRNASGTIV